MSRIRKAYESRFRALIKELNGRRLEQGVRWWSKHARQLSQSDGISPTHAFEQSVSVLRERVHAFSKRRSKPENGNLPPEFRIKTAANVSYNRQDGCPTFLCDAGLGGLARWLRAAGYESLWQPDIGDAELLREAQRLRATVLTTDSLMMERGVLRDGIIPAFWLPPTLTMQEQLALVLREFRLTIRAARCMTCGGKLEPVEKELVRERIPPRTWHWVDEYFVCARCNQLFWHGTHWRRIRVQLANCSNP
jgi:uncharacterized protein with PIN domain